MTQYIGATGRFFLRGFFFLVAMTHPVVWVRWRQVSRAWFLSGVAVEGRWGVAALYRFARSLHRQARASKRRRPLCAARSS